jgi:hypothetical protein
LASLGTILALALPLSLAAQPAPRVTSTVAAPDLQAVHTLRHDVWKRWFTGDTTRLRALLPSELIAISADGWRTLDETIAGSARFAANGGSFVSVTFEQERAHRFGDTVILFSNYTLVTARGGERNTQRGRATEVFVRTGGKWVHTSWHLDSSV